MQVPLQVTFRDLPPSDAIAARVRESVRTLERCHRRIAGCHVAIEAPDRRRRRGGPYYVTVDLMLPGRQIVAGKGRSRHHAHRNLLVALADAFAAARRQIVANHASRRRG